MLIKPVPVASVCATVLSVPLRNGGLGVAVHETFEIGIVDAPEIKSPPARTVIVHGLAAHLARHS